MLKHARDMVGAVLIMDAMALRQLQSLFNFSINFVLTYEPKILVRGHAFAASIAIEMR
jgi:hypothetical protein